MCTASIRGKKTRDAKVGDRLVVALTEDTGEPYMKRPDDPNGLVSCVKHGWLLSVSGVPLSVQETCGLPETFEVIFAMDPGEIMDKLWIGNPLEDGEEGRFLLLYDFPEREGSYLSPVRALTCAELDGFQRRCDAEFGQTVFMSPAGTLVEDPNQTLRQPAPTIRASTSTRRFDRTLVSA